MRLPTALLCVLFLSAAGGCTAFEATDKRRPWTEARWKEQLREDRLRLMSEDERPASAGSVLASPFHMMGQFLADLYNYYLIGNTPGNAARKMLDPDSPDRRIEGIFYLVDRRYGRRPPYTDRYGQVAGQDGDWLVRAVAVRALNRSRDRSAAPVYVKSLSDRSDQVRLEAAKALANMPDERAVPHLLRHLEGRIEVMGEGGKVEVREETRDVRLACADALRAYRTTQVAQALIRVLQDRDFGVSWQALQSLRLMTGRDYGYDQNAWLEQLAGGKLLG